MHDNSLRIKKALERWNQDLTDEQGELFNHYLESIMKWSKKINITAVKDRKGIIDKHFIDSLAAINFIPEKVKKMIDIGTGAGLPGLPIKILRPDISLTLVDSSKKKMKVLDDICKKLSITNYQIIDQNIEILGHDKHHRNQYDIVVCRALASMNVLLEYGLPLLKVKGRMIIYKGPMIDDEVEKAQQALSLLNGKILEKAYFKMPFTDIKRSLVIVEKLGTTPFDYPRRVGFPKKRPL